MDYNRPALRVLEAREISRKRLNPGDLLLEASGGGPGTPVGRVALHNVQSDELDYICSNFFRVLRPNMDLVHPEYLTHLLVAAYRSPSIWRYQQQTTGLVNLKLGDYLRQSLWIPPIHEQARIVEIVAAFDEAEQRAEASIAKFEALRSGLIEELAELECGKFGDVLNQGPQNGIYKPASSYGLQGTPIVRIDSFSRGKSDFTRGLLRVSVNGGEIARYGLDVGDIIINRVNTVDLVGKSTSVRRLIESTIFESNMMRCKLHRSLADPVFTEVWLESSTVRRHFLTRAKSAISQASINGDDVRNCPFPKMDVPGQLAFLERLDAVEGQRLVENAELAKLRRLKQGLVDDLLTGRVAVSALAA
ncbi:restriction endonuclease subunit S [Streptomyces nigra]|uniref:restriction endonuclease subunit S n=1 Tax=Streptomyces nigra TaxID=1827580 RepID=UPI0037FDA155